jgi:hypothetical protein
MLFECCTYGFVSGIVVDYVRKRYAAHFGGKARTDLDGLHRRFLRILFICAKSPPKRGVWQDAITPPESAQ